MRRPIVSVLFVLLCLLPVRAEANFWKWVDRLSGPQFFGLSGEVRIWCGWEDGRKILEEDLKSAAAKYERAARSARNVDRPYFQAAVDAAVLGLQHLEAAKSETPPSRSDDPNSNRLVAFQYRNAAIAIFQLARAQEAGEVILTGPPALPSMKVFEKTAGAPVIGPIFSLCGGKPLDRRRFSFTARGAWALNTHRDFRKNDNRMVQLGGAFEWVLVPAFSAGAGMGAARFYSATPEASAWKLYINPWTIDFRPLALTRGSQLGSPWRHVPLVRYEGLTFVGGFDAGAFGPNSTSYPTELVHSIGVYTDFEPLFRMWRKKW